MNRGFFITFEGVDGSGKTTQLVKIKDYLEEKGYDVVVTKEPGALDLGKQIRKILLHSQNTISDRCEMFLFLADRANHTQMLIEPSLEEGKIVLCDRYVDSTIAYQGYGRGQNLKLLKELNNIASCNLQPDLTLLFDTDLEITMQRLGNEKDRMEDQGLEFYKRVQNGYLELQKENQKRMKIIDANNSIENVYKSVKIIIEDLLKGN